MRRGAGPAQGQRYPGRKLEVTAVTSAIIMPLAVGSWAHLQLLRAGPGPAQAAQAQLALLEVIMPPVGPLRLACGPGPSRYGPMVKFSSYKFKLASRHGPGRPGSLI